MYVYQHQRAPNDTNGNPRRLWRVWTVAEPDIEGYGQTVAVVDEGYGNFPRDRFPGAIELSSVNITGPAYTAALRVARQAQMLVRAG